MVLHKAVSMLVMAILGYGLFASMQGIEGALNGGDFNFWLLLIPFFILGYLWLTTWIRWQISRLATNVLLLGAVVTFVLGLGSGMVSWMYKHVYLPVNQALAKSNQMGYAVPGVNKLTLGKETLFIPIVILIVLVIAMAVYLVRDKRAREFLDKLFNLSKTKEDIDYSLTICKDHETNTPVVIDGKARFLHFLILGATGSGKTSQGILPIIYQDIKRPDVAMTVIEPKGDLVRSCAEMLDVLEVEGVVFDPLREDCPTFNPLEGPPEIVAETITVTLKTLFGDQEPFFALLQENLLRKSILLMKYIHGDDLNFIKLAEFLNDPHEMEMALKEFQRQRRADKKDITRFFYQEILGDNAKKMNEFTIGLRQQVEQIITNSLLRRCLVPKPGHKSDINLDEHLRTGGKLFINTAIGELQLLSKYLGLFIMLHTQYAIFRRPLQDRRLHPHTFIIDEFGQYVNPNFKITLEMARDTGTSVVLATQNLSQMVERGDTRLRDVVVTNCRNRLVFGGIFYEDALLMSRNFGTKPEFEKRYSSAIGRTGKGSWTTSTSYQEKDKPIFTPEELMQLPFGQAAYQVIQRNSTQPARLGETDFVQLEKKAQIRDKKAALSKKGNAIDMDASRVVTIEADNQEYVIEAAVGNPQTVDWEEEVVNEVAPDMEDDDLQVGLDQEVKKSAVVDVDEYLS